jgi:hypothetical protein
MMIFDKQNKSRKNIWLNQSKITSYVVRFMHLLAINCIFESHQNLQNYRRTKKEMISNYVSYVIFGSSMALYSYEMIK